MQIGSAIKALLGNVKQVVKYGSWREIGIYNAMFSSFGKDIYQSEIIRSCIRAIAENTSKANVKCIRRVEAGKIVGENQLQRLIQYRPNLYMNGKDFLYKVRALLEIYNTVFIFIKRDDKGRCVGLYPVPQANCEALDVQGRLYIKFLFATGDNLIAGWEDLAVLRKDYVKSDIFGDENTAIYGTLNLLHTLNQGQQNAIKSTANLRGILKSTKAMLDGKDLKKSQEQFIRDYMNSANEGGIASLDATQDFIPITMQPAVANYKHFEEQRNNIYRYYGVNENILTSKAYGDEWEAFYESRIEPFLIALGLELTNKIFTERERGFGNEIIFEANRLAYASTSAKMNMVNLIDRGVLTINEYREILNLSPVEGGDVRVIRKEYTEAQNLNAVQGIKEEGGDVADEIQQGVSGAGNALGSDIQCEED